MVWLLLILLVGGALAPFVVDHLRPKTSADERNAAKGHLAALPQGQTYITWDGPEDGKILVAVHGLTTPSYVYDALVPGLVAMGYRVMRYDHIGRGLSDPPTAPQTAGFFIDHLCAILEHEAIDPPEQVTLMGYSMGGSIVSAFAAEHPDRVSQLILLAPAGLGITESSGAVFARRVPLIGDWLMEIYGRWSLKSALQAERQERIEVGGVVDKQLDAFAKRGYLRAVLSSMRGILSDSQEDVHDTIAKSGCPVAAIWGESDETIPLQGMSTLGQVNRDAKQIAIKGAGHGLAYSHPKDVLDALQKLIK